MFIVIPLIAGAYALTVSAKAASSDAVKRILPRHPMTIAVVDPSDGAVIEHCTKEMGIVESDSLAACLEEMS
jgi:hypothetical protein